MRGGSRGVIIVIQRDGTTHSRTLRIPRWGLRVGALAGTVLLVGLGLIGVFYLPIVGAAARVPGLERQVARLQGDEDRGEAAEVVPLRNVRGPNPAGG